MRFFATPQCYGLFNPMLLLTGPWHSDSHWPHRFPLQLPQMAVNGLRQHWHQRRILAHLMVLMSLCPNDPALTQRIDDSNRTDTADFAVFVHSYSCNDHTMDVAVGRLDSFDICDQMPSAIGFSVLMYHQPFWHVSQGILPYLAGSSTSNAILATPSNSMTFCQMPSRCLSIGLLLQRFAILCMHPAPLLAYPSCLGNPKVDPGFYTGPRGTAHSFTMASIKKKLVQEAQPTVSRRPG